MLMIDTLLVSPLGEISLAAMGIATTIIAFILGIQIALANGTQLVLSRAVGSGHQENLNKAFVSGVIINGLTSLLFWLLLSVFDQVLIESLTDNLSLHIEIASYLNITKYVILFTAITQVIIALFNGLGKSRIPFKGYLIELPINALASYLYTDV
ncbi:MATE family efflux transporter [Psychromonas sp. PT13]|uniref:MATE family efflux transporter n=1 Tax=Psychromonas sp. PT13 TaxID=3439547 RepID=UPI003EC117E5